MSISTTACKVGIGVVILRDDYVLLGRRKVDPYKGMLALPGGTVDGVDPQTGEPETATDAVYREVYEETGMIVEMANPVPLWVDEGRNHKNGNPYVCVFFSATPGFREVPYNREPDKCEGWGWVKMCDLPHGEMPPYTATAINLAFELATPDYPY